MKCPFHSDTLRKWTDRCEKEGTVKLRSPAMDEGRPGMRIDVCEDHEKVYRSAGWVDR